MEALRRLQERCGINSGEAALALSDAALFAFDAASEAENPQEIDLMPHRLNPMRHYIETA
jgi:hypothetical protein